MQIDSKEKSIKIELDFSFLQSTTTLLNGKQKRSKVHGWLWDFCGNNKIVMKSLCGKSSDTLLSSLTSSKTIIWNEFSVRLYGIWYGYLVLCWFVIFIKFILQMQQYVPQHENQCKKRFWKKSFLSFNVLSDSLKK